MALPTLTPEQRAKNLEAAAEARKARAALKERLKKGETTLVDVLKSDGEDKVVAKLKVSALLESLPGVGKAKAAKVMEDLEISPTRSVRGLGAKQRAALLEVFAEGSGA